MGKGEGGGVGRWGGGEVGGCYTRTDSFVFVKQILKKKKKNCYQTAP